jgi:hypothetical protein
MLQESEVMRMCVCYVGRLRARYSFVPAFSFLISLTRSGLTSDILNTKLMC